MRFAPILASCLAFAASAPAAAGAFDFFPLEPGNVWVSETAAGHHVMEVSDGESLGGGWYASDASGLLGSSAWIYDSDDEDELYSYSGGWSALFNFGASVGDTWTYAASPCDTFDVEVGAGGQAATPAGIFTGTSEFFLDHAPQEGTSCTTPPVSAVRFAEGVGPVQFVDGQGDTGRLIYARVGGEVEAMAPGETGSTDDLEISMVLTNDLPGIADTIGVLVVLTNVSGSAKTITMPAGQPFVIDIFERLETTPVGSWSGGTGGSMTLEAGASHILFGDVSLDADWSGDYTFQGSLSSSAGLPALSVDLVIQ